jgi:adenylylsulfate kinase
MNNQLIVWMTGLSGSGKTTLAQGLSAHLKSQGIASFILDGDLLRKGINKDLDFSRMGRKENVRRVSEIAALFADAGIIPIIAVIAPYQTDRQEVRTRLADYNYKEVFVKCSVGVCEQRDPKGLYKKARQQTISGFTGISDAFDLPIAPDITIDTEHFDFSTCLAELTARLDLGTTPTSPEHALPLEAEYQ